MSILYLFDKSWNAGENAVKSWFDALLQGGNQFLLKKSKRRSACKKLKISANRNNFQEITF